MKNKPTLLPWILLAIISSIFIYIRLRLINLPLERDEGEYAYGGQLILSGSPPYREIYNMKFPGVYSCYSLFIFLFGNSIAAIRLGALFINLLTACLIFKTVEVLHNRVAGIFATIGFIALSSSPHFLGITANTEHFVNLFVVLSACFLVKWVKQPKSYLLILTGIAAGLACIMKQHGSYFLLVALLAVFSDIKWNGNSIGTAFKNAFILVSGFLFALLALLASVCFTGTFQKFYFLTIQYSSNYISYKSFGHELPKFFISLANNMVNNHIMWLVVLAGIFLSYRLLPRNKFLFLLSWLILSCVAIFPGYYFRTHYYIYILPASAIYSGLLFNWLFEWGYLQSGFRRRIPLTLFIGSFIYFLVGERAVFFFATPAQASVRLYGGDPSFCEALTISNYINQHSPKNGRLLVLGSDPEIYFYTQRKAATAYIYEYPLVEPQPFRDSMRSEFIRQSVLSNPTTIINARTASYDEALHRQLLLYLHVNTDFDLKGYCYQKAWGHDVFVWNSNEGSIPTDSIMWEIYEKRPR